MNNIRKRITEYLDYTKYLKKYKKGHGLLWKIISIVVFAVSFLDFILNDMSFSSPIAFIFFIGAALSIVFEIIEFVKSKIELEGMKGIEHRYDKFPIDKYNVLYMSNIKYKYVNTDNNSADRKKYTYCNETNNEDKIELIELVVASDESHSMTNLVEYSPTLCTEIATTKESRCLWCMENIKKEDKVNNYISQHFDEFFPVFYQHYKENNYFCNEEKFCLFGKLTLSSENENINTIFHGCYYNTYLTNKIYCSFFTKQPSKNKKYPPISGFLDKNSRGEIVFPIDEFSNEIGVSTLAITADGYIIIQIQGGMADSSKNLYVPSGSGSADWDDYLKIKNENAINDKVSLEKVIQYACERELFEEANVQEGCKVKTKLLGFFRWVNYGWKPEFVALSVLNCNYMDLYPNVDEQTEDFFDGEEGEKKCDFRIIIPGNNSTQATKIDGNKMKEELLSLMNKRKCSVPLYFNLKMLQSVYLEDNGAEIIRFFDESIREMKGKTNE